MDIFLETDRLILRRFTRADVDVLVELDSDPEVMHFLRTFHQPWPDPIPGDDQGDVEYALTRAEWEGEHRGG